MIKDAAQFWIDDIEKYLKPRRHATKKVAA